MRLSKQKQYDIAEEIKSDMYTKPIKAIDREQSD
jgi:hypothetical protein